MDACPVVRVINEIRGGGFDDDGDRGLVKLGGGGGACFILDDMSFYIMSRKMELARFELTKPSEAACRLKYRIMFPYATTGATYAHIMNNVFKKKYVYDQFMQLVTLIEKMESLIIDKISNMSAQQMNVSLPDIILLPDVDQFIHHPAVLCKTMNQIIDYINKIDVNSLLRESVRTNIAKIECFKGDPPEMSTRFTPAQNIPDMKKMLDLELSVAGYVKNVEEYHCYVIDHVNEIYDACGRIIDGLVS